MTPENDVNIAQPEVEDIEVEVTDAPAQEASSDDELENYTKSVSKRINKLNARNRETEQRAAQLEAALQQKEAEVHAYYQQAAQAQQSLIAKEEEVVETKEREANELYKKAHASGDADLMSKADSLKSDVALQKEKVRIAKQRQEQEIANTQQTQLQTANVQQQTPQVVPPSEKALRWKEKNDWLLMLVDRFDLVNWSYSFPKTSKVYINSDFDFSNAMLSEALNEVANVSNKIIKRTYKAIFRPDLNIEEIELIFNKLSESTDVLNFRVLRANEETLELEYQSYLGIEDSAKFVTSLGAIKNI